LRKGSVKLSAFIFIFPQRILKRLRALPFVDDTQVILQKMKTKQTKQTKQTKSIQL